MHGDSKSKENAQKEPDRNLTKEESEKAKRRQQLLQQQQVVIHPLQQQQDDHRDKPNWNISVGSGSTYDKIQRAQCAAEAEEKAKKNSALKNQAVATTRMGLIHRHNAVAAAIREAKTKVASTQEEKLPPTIAAIRRSERQARDYEHTGAWEKSSGGANDVVRYRII